MRKTKTVAELIRGRVVHADDALSGLPGERRLAEELGVSRTTVRAAIGALVDEGVLSRQDNGRIAPSRRRRRSAGAASIGFIMPANASPDYQLWLDGAAAAVEGSGVVIRPVAYAHDGDASLHQALGGFDASFLILGPAGVPAWLPGRLKSSGRRVVVLDLDLSAEGIPSVVMFPPSACTRLLEHLRSLGHRSIDCVNSQATDPVIRDRIEAWRSFLATHELAGSLRTVAGGRPIEGGYRVVKDALRDGRPVGTALYCTTGPAAVGAMRALHEEGLEIGRDASVCAVNDEGLGRFLETTLTAVESAPRARYLRLLLPWMTGGGTYRGPLRVEPEDVPLYLGESTGPAPKTKHVRT